MAEFQIATNNGTDAIMVFDTENDFLIAYERDGAMKIIQCPDVLDIEDPLYTRESGFNSLIDREFTTYVWI